MIGLLHHSLDKKEKIMIYYIDRHNNVTQRVIRVVGIDDKRILAYCYYKKQVRSFKIENILSIGCVKRSVGA
ncbi:hypothetical protein J18TS1_37940 [Oceanobacillus oncorhynchi subsp. incaldanensis]|uniref:WYL domain-containing protein n=2 Tax=Oceanobacillus TaxID=182709 RepID=A0A0A1MLP1_9BACI|nr:hypothetical protein [Oceanobacillus oncorhynchi]MDM8098982.1 hypothetical protein [Oceanobacillus oncorhynchi]UUI39762.1 hypothetical protein NP440_20960 [Oceanobacillus oncorhynchi]GIO20694.1 hypothetical protein J18TS1_37940 [Oceanobacillus oncorhynchi subsp. incaldanensis]CEI80602.1 hypothetical protein BN997_00408 [Oceanobacillus oncorhynchi]